MLELQSFGESFPPRISRAVRFCTTVQASNGIICEAFGLEDATNCETSDFSSDFSSLLSVFEVRNATIAFVMAASQLRRASPSRNLRGKMESKACEKNSQRPESWPTQKALDLINLDVLIHCRT